MHGIIMSRNKPALSCDLPYEYQMLIIFKFVVYKNVILYCILYNIKTFKI
jgi:hypothetical protein